jgi:hypothetical protein
MMIAETSTRKLDAPRVSSKQVDGTRYEDREKIQQGRDGSDLLTRAHWRYGPSLVLEEQGSDTYPETLEKI